MKGHVEDTNSHYLCHQLWLLGVKVCMVGILLLVQHHVQLFSSFSHFLPPSLSFFPSPFFASLSPSFLPLLSFISSLSLFSPLSHFVQVATVPDAKEPIVEVVRRFSSAYDFVLTTGGIGPTHDDVTMEGERHSCFIRHSTKLEGHVVA